VTTYAIGDVQGCYASLMRLLERIDFDSGRDVLWFVGDLVNRGPDSLSVLRFVRGLGNRAVTVLGNHDLHLLAIYEGVRNARSKDTLAAVLAAPDCAELMDWLAHRALLHVDDELGFAMVHAGIPSIWSLARAETLARELEAVLRGPARREFLGDMYGNDPALWREDLSGNARLRTITNYFTRMRVLDADGRLNLEFSGPPAAAPVGYRPWFEDYRAAQLPVRLVFGHWAALSGECDVPGLFALDTGCVWGGRLTALQFVGPERFSVASVQ
jgi:bis(5'-nucleosyl)-tetraphosphatase (symmetrical)